MKKVASKTARRIAASDVYLTSAPEHRTACIHIVLADGTKVVLTPEQGRSVAALVEYQE